jgi:putative transposase
MARPPRICLPGQPHHVIQRGNNRSTIFASDDDFRFYYESLRSATTRFNCLVHAYVFMTNHVHLLMSPLGADSLGLTMRSLGIRYAGYFNRCHARTGALFESRYRSHVIDSDMYLFACHRYIEENPRRGGFVNELPEYPWSSYRANALGAEDPVLTPHERFVALGRSSAERQAFYRALFRDEIRADALMAIRFGTRSCVSETPPPLAPVGTVADI